MSPTSRRTRAIIPGSLCALPVDRGLVPDCSLSSKARTVPAPELHDRAWWAAKTSAFDFSSEDKIDADAFNRVLSEGIKGARR